MAARGTETPAAGPPSFARSAAFTYGSSLLAAVVSLVNVLVLARVLGAEGRGQVAFLTAIAWFVSSLATLGLPESNANFAAARPEVRRSLATNSVLSALVLGVVSFVGLYVLIWAFPGVAGDSDPALRWLTFAFLPVLILQPCLRFLAQADYAFPVTNAAYILPALINLLVNGMLAGFGALTVGMAVVVWLSGQTAATVLVGWFVASRLAGFGRPDADLARQTLRFGAKAHVGRIMQLGNYRLDQWLLGAIAGSRELGLYSIAVAWAEALWYLPTALAAVQRPRLVRALQTDAVRQAAEVFRAVMLLTGAMGVVMIVAAPFLCTVIFGAEFAGSVDDLRLLVLGAFGMVALKLLGNTLVARGYPLLQSSAVASGFVVTVVLDVLLIPPFGGAGAAAASTIAYTVAGVVVGAAFIQALGGRVVDLLPRPSDAAVLARGARELTRRPAARGV